MELSKSDLQFKFAAPLRRQLHEFWVWWSGELEAVLPQSLRRLILPRIPKVYLDLEGPEVAVSLATTENSEHIASFHLNASADPESADPEARALIERVRDLVLCLPPDKVLSRSLTLPLAAEENLREVLGFEMSRKTPFNADQVYYDYRITAREPAKSILTLDLVATPRQVLDELLEQLAELGISPQQVTSRQADGLPFPVNLYPAGNRNRSSVRTRYINLALGTLALVLLAGAIALPLLQKKELIRSLEAKLATTSEQARLALRLRQEVERLTVDSRYLVEKKQARPLTLELISELTHLLPDDTWITRFVINGAEIQIQGQSDSAANLIPLVESSPSLHQARFRSPVTKAPRTQKERFQISTETRQRGES